MLLSLQKLATFYHTQLIKNNNKREEMLMLFLKKGNNLFKENVYRLFRI